MFYLDPELVLGLVVALRYLTYPAVALAAYMGFDWPVPVLGGCLLALAADAGILGMGPSCKPILPLSFRWYLAMDDEQFATLVMIPTVLGAVILSYLVSWWVGPWSLCGVILGGLLGIGIDIGVTLFAPGRSLDAPWRY